MNKLKAYFMILNVMLAIVAFNYIISAADDVAGTSGTTPIPGSTGSSGTTNINPGSGTPITTIIDQPIGGVTGVGGTGPIGTIGGTTIPPTGGGTTIPPGGTTPPTETEPPGGWGGGSINLQSIITKATIGAGIFGTIGSLAGGENGALWGSVAGAVGGIVAGVLEGMGLDEITSSIVGLVVAGIIFLLTYYKIVKEVHEFFCLPWEAPIGGDDCQLCNQYEECSQYTCKSLGQACDIINSGTTEQKCIWKNPNDVNSPIIKMTKVNKDHRFEPNRAIRPPATGVRIVNEKSKDGCLKAYTPLEFTFTTIDTDTGVGEPAQCKVDYVISNNSKTMFDELAYFVGGDSLYLYNHTEKLALPGPDAMNAAAPILKNDGEYSLFIMCRDGNGNFNQDPFAVSFCVEKGPDVTPPIITGTNLESGKPVQFNQTKLKLEVYVNEPSECRWSRTDLRYEYMENNMSCDTNVWEMNNNLVYTCKTTLNGIIDRKTNDYYFRCKDKPWAAEADRNVNLQSYHYSVIGTQPLNIMSISPKENETMSSAADSIPVFLTIETDNGYNNGEAICYYKNGKPTKEEQYIPFLNTSASTHVQRQDLVAGTYNYYFKCVDLGGNTAYSKTTFKVVTDRSEPRIARVYRDVGDLKIITTEEAKCTYSLKDCNYEIDSGVEMASFNQLSHTTEWKLNQNFYVRCKDKYDNQPNPNVCSIIVRPSKLEPKQEVIEL